MDSNHSPQEDRASALLEAAKGWSVFAGWLCEHVDQCTCDGPFETYGHRPECGLVPIAETGKVPALAFAEEARALIPDLLAEIRRLRAGGDSLAVMCREPVRVRVSVGLVLAVHDTSPPESHQEAKPGETWDLGGREQQLVQDHICIGKPDHDGDHKCCCGHKTGGEA